MGEKEHTSPPEGRKSPSQRRIITAVTLTGALIAGVLALALPAIAQTDSSDSGTGTDGGASVDTATTGEATVEEAIKGRLAEALALLVADGTITEGQRDAVIEALWTARTSAGAGQSLGRHRGRPHGGLQAGAPAGELAGLLNLTPAELAARLRAGDTLADVAADTGVETSAVVELLVEAATARLDAAVESGRIDSDDRDTCLTAITAAIAARVDGEAADRATVGNSCGHNGDRDSDGDNRRHGRSALGRLQFRR